MATPFSIVPQVAIGTGVGAAVGATVQPKLQDFLNQQWAKNANRRPAAAMLAQGVAQGQIAVATAGQWALETGYGPDVFSAMVDIANTGPGTGEAFRLWRRDKINDARFAAALKRGGIEDEWIEALLKTKDEPLSPPVVALAIVRGIIRDPGFLPVGPPTTEGNVQAFPTSNLDALTEAAAFGFDRDRLFVQTAISGRPMGPESAAEAYFKGILQKVDFDRAISEGDVRNEWAEAILENHRPIPSPIDYVQGKLRNWITVPEMHKGAARKGMSPEDVDFLELIHGRPATAHQVFIGLRRGGTYNGPVDDVAPAFLKALQESDIRPEWYNLLWHGRYTYPTAFVLRALTESGDLTEQDTEQILLYEGWEPQLAAKVAAKWATPAAAAAKADPRVARSETFLFTAMHKAAVGAATEPPAIQEGFDALGVPAEAQATIRNLWAIEGRL